MRPPSPPPLRAACEDPWTFLSRTPRPGGHGSQGSGSAGSAFKVCRVMTPDSPQPATSHDDAPPFPHHAAPAQVPLEFAERQSADPPAGVPTGRPEGAPSPRAPPPRGGSLPGGPPPPLPGGG